MDRENINLIQSITLKKHPMKSMKLKYKKLYFIWLEYLVLRVEEKNSYLETRLNQYHAFLIGKENTPTLTDEILHKKHFFIGNYIVSWRKKIPYWLLCDIALIIRDDAKIKSTAILISELLGKRKSRKIDIFLSELQSSLEMSNSMKHTTYLANQYRINRDFGKQRETRFIIASNVSSGKSTLINAIVGKHLTRTSQEICTGNLCYIYNKPYEDNLVHLSSTSLNLNASESDISQLNSSAKSSIASYFRTTFPIRRVCIIDTPGVNSSINKQHRKITYDLLKGGEYDKLIYIINANKLGTDEEKESLDWISKHIQKDKVVFVLNKLDTFSIYEDSIEISLKNVRKDLKNIGYDNPIICPLSSYFAYLTKLKFYHEYMTEDEIDQYNLFVKKFSKNEYDLSTYQDNIHHSSDNAHYGSDNSEFIQLSKKCGLFALEQILYGGNKR